MRCFVPKSVKSQSAALISVFFLFYVSACSATTTYVWDDSFGDHNWNTAANWNLNAVPPNNSSTYASIQMASGPVVDTGETVNVYRILLNGAANGTLTVNDGIVNVGQHVYLGGQTATDKGTLNMNGGAINITATIYISQQAGSTGTLNLLGGTISCAALNMGAAGGTAGKINIEAGTLTINNEGATNVNTYISKDWIKAYNGSGTLLVDTTTVPGKTILSAQSQTKAETPSPANSAANVARNLTLSWTPGNGATSHNVYFGTTSPGTFQGNQTAASFNPGTLEFDAAYYWRIDEVSGSIITAGDVWSFTTVSGKAKNPDPAIGTINVPINKILRWKANPFAASHDVYFGTSVSDVTNTNRLLGDLNGNGLVDWPDVSLLGVYWLADPAGTEPYAGVNLDGTVDFMDFAMLAPDWDLSAGTVFKGNQDPNSFNAGALAIDTTYYWRVDEVNGPDTAVGNIWSFTTQSSEAINPSPETGSSALTNSILSWTPGAGAGSHNVYFGTTNPPAFKGNQTATTYNPVALANSTTYYWKIDEIGTYGTITGDTWSFTTVPLNTTPIYQYLSWRNDPTNSVVVNWWNGDAQGDSTVDYGPTSLYGSTVIVPAISNFHHVELTGLTPGSTIHYRPRSSDGTIGADATYTVPAASTNSFSFAVFGDTRSSDSATEPFYTRHQQLCNWMLAQDFDFILQGGDTVNRGGATNGFWEYEDFFRLESNLSKSKVIMATMGNHEVQPSNDAPYIYYDLYTSAFPANGPAVDGKGRVYSFNYGNAHFVSLGSYQVDLNAQATWLSADLAAARANPNIKWIFVYFHAPMYTTTDPSTQRGNRTDEINAWGPIFDTHHVDIAFQSHNHIYERSYSLKAGAVVSNGVGTVYITTGLGGAGFEGLNNASPGLFAVKYSASSYTYGSAATCVTITGNNLSCQTISQDNGAVRDSFTLTKP